MNPFSPSQLQQRKAELLRHLHHGPRILVLPNAWDAASARIFEDAGFPAIATSSAAVANSLGYADGQRLARDEMLAVVARIVAAVDVPVTADMEAGYANTPAGVAETTTALLETGAVGMNFEDSVTEEKLVDIDEQVARIKAIRAASIENGTALVLNARIDAYLLPQGTAAQRLAETLRRGPVYERAGADCLYPIGLCDKSAIERLTRKLNMPINILASPGAPPIAELEKMGVRRVTLGAYPMRATMGLVRRIAQELREKGTYNTMIEGTMSGEEANGLFKR